MRYRQEVVREVDAKVEIRDSFHFCGLVAVCPVLVVLTVVSVTSSIGWTSTEFGVRAFDVQDKSGRVGGL